jgi:hypothetical protein
MVPLANAELRNTKRKVRKKEPLRTLKLLKTIVEFKAKKEGLKKKKRRLV